MGRGTAIAALVLVLSACSSAAPVSPPSPTPTAMPSPSAAPPSPHATSPPAAPPHVILAVLENKDYDTVIGNSDAPTLNALAQRYGLATQSYARTHPSLPNYLELVAGQTFGITSDCTTCSVEGPTVVDQLSDRGYGWAAYMENMPSPCFVGDSYNGLYARKHDPLIYVDHIRNDRTACARIQPFTGFYAALDAGTLPPFVEVTPNMCHDGHDCSLHQSDTWVGGFVARLTASSWFRDGGVLILTYDEGSSGAGCCRVAAGGRIATWVVSRSTPAGARMASPVDHAGVLRTVEELFGLPFLGDAACACSGDLRPLLGG